jgi:2,3-bisphosphoglycerate-dependent phosphoglycerate mutase
MRYLLASLLVLLVSCKATTVYYVVRHAEKETTTGMSADVPLSVQGKQRAEALREMLKDEKIKEIYSTNYIRTKSTAQPLADLLHVNVETYSPSDTSFVTRVKTSSKGNVLIVGHSNTVDDIVNKLTGKTEVAGDLPDSEYGDLFVVKKKGNHYSFERKHFGN